MPKLTYIEKKLAGIPTDNHQHRFSLSGSSDQKNRDRDRDRDLDRDREHGRNGRDGRDGDRRRRSHREDEAAMLSPQSSHSSRHGQPYDQYRSDPRRSSRSQAYDQHGVDLERGGLQGQPYDRYPNDLSRGFQGQPNGPYGADPRYRSPAVVPSKETKGEEPTDKDTEKKESMKRYLNHDGVDDTAEGALEVIGKLAQVL